MTGAFLLYLATGRLLIWTGQKFLSENKFLQKLVSCDFCLGTWIYLILALLFKITILQDIFPYVPFLSELVTGVASSFIIHLLNIGYHAKFDVIVI